jgi:hypothetical protein
MRVDNSWQAAARKYVRVYQALASIRESEARP